MEKTPYIPSLVVFVFIVLGGPIGGFAGALMLLPEVALRQPDSIGTWFSVAVLATIGGLPVGVIPASLTGLAYAYSPRSLQRIVVAPLLGFGVTAALCVATIRRTWEATDFGLAILGAVAALAVAALLRWLGLDRRGAEK